MVDNPLQHLTDTSYSVRYLESRIAHLHVLQGAGFLQLFLLQLLQSAHVAPVNLEQLVHGIQCRHRAQAGSPG